MIDPAELRALIAAAGLTQGEVAALCCVERRTVERWLAGAPPCPPGASALLRLRLAIRAHPDARAARLEALARIAAAP